MSTPTTVTELFEAYIAAKSCVVRGNTLSQNRMGIRWFLRANGNIPFREATRSHAQAMRRLLVGNYPNKTTVTDYMKGAATIFRWACFDQDWMDRDIFCRLHLTKQPHKPLRIYTDSEIQAMCDVADTAWQVKILLGYYCGLRLSEVLNLRRCDIDLSQGIVSIRSHPDEKNGWPWKVKTWRSDRRVSFNGKLARVIKGRLAALPQAQPYLTLMPREYKKVMVLKHEGRLTEERCLHPITTTARIMAQLQEKAGIPHGTFHNLRHSFGTNCLLGGMQIDVVAKLMGNTRQVVANYYVEINEGRAMKQLRDLQAKPTFGVAEFESTALRPPAVRSTKLSYTP